MSPAAVNTGTSIGELIVICFGIMSIQFLYTYIEFFIVETLCIMLLPFGALTQTSYIAQNAIKSIVAIGIKVMVLVFLTVIIYPIITIWKIDFEHVSIAQASEYGVAVAAIAYLFFKAPSVAAGIAFGNSQFETAGFATSAFNTIQGGFGKINQPEQNNNNGGGNNNKSVQDAANLNKGKTPNVNTGGDDNGFKA